MMGYRQEKKWWSLDEKLEALKALRGQHDQRIRCGVIEIMYGQRGETNRFLEDQIRRMEAHIKWNTQQQGDEDRRIINRERAKAEKALWAAGQNEDGD
jgi:hypothetical protein